VEWYQPEPIRREWYSAGRFRAWLEANTDRRPAVLFPPEEITAADFGPTDFDVFLRTDPTVELFAKILFEVTQPDGSVPEKAEIERVIYNKKLPSPSPTHQYWSGSLVEVAARAVLNFLKATR